MSGYTKQRSSKPVAIWLMVGVVMLIIQILLGGITRLTGSGLSITEWNVVTGTFPPTNEASWMTEFNKYQETPQYRLLNTDFTLKDFKFIFFWEWLHRFWARLIGVVFIIPFIVFLVQKRFSPPMVKPMIILFLLGALQGAVGWIMVASGLTGDAIYVKPTRLALHFIFALALLCYTFWFALRLLIRREDIIVRPQINKLTWIALGVLFLQLVYGALMAGNKAAPAAATWPDINGQLIPSGIYYADEGLLNFLDNKIMIHFIHRSLAYILVVLILWLTIRMYKTVVAGSFLRFRAWPMILVILQVLLGVLTVLNSLHISPNTWGVFEWMAQLHQAVAMLLLLSLTAILFYVRRRQVQ